MSVGIALVGYGHIARHQHVPAILADPAFRLVGIANPDPVADAPAPVFETLAGMLDELGSAIHAVAICTPPRARYALAREAIARGKAVLLEKPTAATLGEAEQLVALAEASGTVLFTAWHSRFAPAVPLIRAMLADDPAAGMTISWAENVRQWHPGQQWIWQPGGFGVFDAGINALSIATHVLHEPLTLAAATLAMPANRQTPIAAELTFGGVGFSATFDWRVEVAQRWLINFTTVGGRRIALSDGGHRLAVDGEDVALSATGEYPALYRRFATLIEQGESDADLAPLRLVADAFLIGQHESVEPFA